MKNILLASSLLLLSLSSCKKDDAPHNTSTVGPYTNLSDVYSQLAPVARNTSLIVSQGGSVTAVGGTRFIVAPNSFQTASGAAVTGSVDIEVNDWVKRGDMIFGKVLPISNGQSLVSGGEAYFNATQNGQPVFLKSGKQVQINLPQFGAPVPGMQLFLGTFQEDAVNNVNWIPAKFDSTKITVIFGTDTISLFSDSMKYINADQFLSAPNYKTFTVLASSPDGAMDNMVCYAVYDTYKGLWPLTNQSGGFSTNHVPGIPVHLVVFGLKNGNFYGGILPRTPSNDSTYIVPIIQTDAAAFKVQLNGL